MVLLNKWQNDLIRWRLSRRVQQRDVWRCRVTSAMFCFRLWNMNLFVSLSHGRSHRPAHVRRSLSQIPSDPPEPPSADGPAPLKHHTHQRQRKIPPNHPRLTQNPSLHHRSLTLHRFILLQSTSSSTLKPLQTSETGSVCGGSTSRQRRSAMWGVDCGWGGPGGLWVLCWVMKQVSLTSEVCGDRTGLRSVWTTVRQEGGVSTGSFCSWHHRGRSQFHWSMSQEGLIRFRLQKQIFTSQTNRFVLDIQFDFSVVSGLR